MYKLTLCLRYLRTRYIALASIISVTLGVATMIVVNSVMAGFSSQMRERIHGILADVIIETNNYDGAADPEKLLAMVKQEVGQTVDGMTATVEIYGMISFQFHGQWITRPVTILGIDPQGKAEVGPLVNYLDSYNEVRDHDGKTVIRQPLRSHDEPPGWELTGPAKDYRRLWTKRQQWMHDSIESAPRGSKTASLDDAHPFETVGVPRGDEIPAGSGVLLASGTSTNKGAGVTTAAGKTPKSQSGKRSATKSADLDGPHFSGEGPGADVENPFDNPNVPAQIAPRNRTAELLTADPLEGRVYVGSGLITFPYEDPETGKIKTMYMIQPGDDVKLSTVSAGRPPDARHFNATVVDVFKSGMSEYDSNLVFCNLAYLQKVRGMIDPTTGVRSVTSIQIKLKDGTDSRDVVRRLQAIFPPGIYSVRTWEQKQGPLLAAVEVESAILNVLLFLIIAVAGFGILAIFFMIVVEKTRDIGIMKALGASSQGVMSIFLGYGLALGIVGSGVGVILGLLFVKHINTIESWITWTTGRKVFDEKIYYFPEIPTAVSPVMVFWVAIGAMAIAVLASILPARRASRLRPVMALRYE